MGTRKCQGFIGLHYFSGADWGGKFVGINKKIWAEAYIALDEDDSAIGCFQNLGTSFIPTQPIQGGITPPPKSRVWTALYAMFIANQDHITFQNCDGKCLCLGNGKEKAYRQHAQPFFSILCMEIT